MFPSHSPEQHAIASQLLEEIDCYEDGLDILVERRWDPDLYRDLSDSFDRMQMFATALPALSGTWTELLISRVELSHAFWKVGSPSRINGRILGVHARHKVLLAEMRRGCRTYLRPAAAAALSSTPPAP
jgi:hypothetical protein